MNKQEKNDRRTVIRALKILDIKDGDLILVKSMSRAHALLNQLALALAERGKSNCLLLVVDNFTEIKIANPEVMEQNGWIKKEQDEAAIETRFAE